MGAPENPPAFPLNAPEAGEFGLTYEGMTLRDWFAGQVLAGIAARDAYDPGQASPQQRARLAYIDADAMLAVRAESAPLTTDIAEPEPDAAEVARWKAAGIANFANGTCTTCEKPQAECDCLPF